MQNPEGEPKMVREKSYINIEHSQIAAFHPTFDLNFNTPYTIIFLKNNPAPLTVTISMAKVEAMINDAIRSDLVSVPFPNIPSKH